MIILAGLAGLLIFGMFTLLLSGFSSIIYASAMGIHFTANHQMPGSAFFMPFWFFFFIGIYVYAEKRDARKFAAYSAEKRRLAQDKPNADLDGT